ncbi:MAG: hypothetical protein JWM99_1902, partial [Verrucomicrobiales bacterium]|nr:hypothetical protein [Verrucomicrobiales bacterium]
MPEATENRIDLKAQTLTFFRQSGWLVVANTACGAFMTLVHSVTSHMTGGDYPLFQTLLRVFLILSIPAAGLQTVLAQQAARSVSPVELMELKGIIRAALVGTFAVWVAAVVILILFQTTIMTQLQVTNPMALWMTVLTALPALWLPVLQGTLQGTQTFSWLGSSMIFNGVVRFSAMVLLIVVFNGKATSAMVAAFLGVFGSLCLAAWPMRSLLVNVKALVWRTWLV